VSRQSRTCTSASPDSHPSCRNAQAIAHDAFRALVNLSDSPMIHPHLAEPPFLTFLVSYVVVSPSLSWLSLSPPKLMDMQHPQATLGDLAAMLLSNLTASSGPCATLLALQIPILQTPSSAGPFYPTQSRAGSCAPPVPYPTGTEINVHALRLLVDAFVQGASVDLGVPLDKCPPRKSELHFLASVFANLSTVSVQVVVHVWPGLTNLPSPFPDVSSF